MTPIEEIKDKTIEEQIVDILYDGATSEELSVYGMAEFIYLTDLPNKSVRLMQLMESYASKRSEERVLEFIEYVNEWMKDINRSDVITHRILTLEELAKQFNNLKGKE